MVLFSTGTVEKFTALAQQEAVCRSRAGERPPLQCSWGAGDEQAEAWVAEWQGSRGSVGSPGHKKGIEEVGAAVLVLMGSLWRRGSGFYREVMPVGGCKVAEAVLWVGGLCPVSSYLYHGPQTAARDSGRDSSSCGDPPVTLEHCSL